MFDRVALALLVLSFGALLTTHVAITIGLARRMQRRRALVAFFAFPLAPWWAWREKMRMHGILWVGAATCYGLGLVATCSA